MNNQCTLLKPLLIVIPAGGMWIDCPVHGRHFIRRMEIIY